MDAILDNIEGDDMTTAEKITQCRALLVDDNLDHPNWRAVGMALKHLEKIQDYETTALKHLEKIQDYETKLKSLKSIAELAAQSIDIRNETDSSSHTKTGHVEASHERLTCPSITLPDSFWNHRSEFNFPEAINGEPEVNMKLYQLLELIINALGLGEYLKPILDVPIMDTAADVMITTKLNKLLCGSVEGKKHPKTEAEKEKIFNSGTQVAGEAFEQLFLVRIQNRTYAVGLIASLQGFQLISTKSDFSDISLDATSAKSFCEAQRQRTQNSLTPDRHQIIANPGIPGRPKKKTKVQVTKAPTKKKGEPKKGRVSIAISSSKTPREFYASDVLSFGNDEDKNREVFSLLATFILLCVESLKDSSSHLIDISPDCPILVRKVCGGTKTFSFKEIRLPSGVQFHTKPKIQRNSVFYAIGQLGYGLSGTSCFACTCNASPCVIKFFREKEKVNTFEEARKEERKWKQIYGEFFGFVKAFDCARAVLVMPFLRVPCCAAERTAIADSYLKDALDHFASKGYIHTEPFWHHIGMVETNLAEEEDENPSILSKWFPKFPWKNNASQAVPVPNHAAVFCDLAHAEECPDPIQRAKWVNKTFSEMRRRSKE